MRSSLPGASWRRLDCAARAASESQSQLQLRVQLTSAMSVWYKLFFNGSSSKTLALINSSRCSFGVTSSRSFSAGRHVRKDIIRGELQLSIMILLLETVELKSCPNVLQKPHEFQTNNVIYKDPTIHKYAHLTLQTQHIPLSKTAFHVQMFLTN